MKKVLSLISSCVMAIALVGCSNGTSSTKGVSGEFTGTAKGLGGDVTVTITLEDSKITNVVAECKDETEGIGTKALESMPEAMKEAGSINVDTVATATVTSNAILEAAKAAIESAGLNPEDYMATSTSEPVAAEDVTKDCDVVVVGAGGAGMTAAITASDAGKSVIIVESQGVAGGNSVRSTGGMNAAKTTYQDENEFGEEAGVEKTLNAAEAYTGDNEDFVKELTETVKTQWSEYQANPTGYFDSVELFELDTMIGGKGINDPELVKTLVENSADAIDWLESIGATLHNVGQFGGAAVKRIHRPVNDEGKTLAVGSYVVPILEKNVEDRGIEVMFNTTANKILTDDNGAACGIVAEGKNGETVTINAKAVVLASGGFGANNEMVAEQNPQLNGYITTNAPGILGQGIKMAQEIGAGTVDMNQIQLHPTVHVAEDGSANLITEGLRGDGAILVNKEAKRFFDEVSTRDKVSAAENEQTDGMAWMIVDQKMYDASTVIQNYVKKGWMVSGDSVEDLAKAMDVDAATLQETIDNWNTCVENKEDAEFGRTSFASPLEGTFYAITVQPGVHHTMGGLTIDTSAEVLDGVHGNAIAGLFAAGEITGGVHGANRLGGNAVADFTVFGRIAGQSAADYAK